MGKIGLYPGTFDPVTNGHLDLIKRSLVFFDELIVGVAVNPSKKPLFSVDERVAMLAESTKELECVTVRTVSCLVVDYAEEVGARAIVRGLRAVSDFETELQMALINRKLKSTIETIFMVPRERYWYLSSKIVKEVALFGGDVSDFVNSSVEGRLKVKLRGKNGLL